MCHVNASCVNTNGTLECNCNSGFTGNGTHCYDVNECVDNTYTCDPNAKCQNTIGSYKCICNTEYRGDGKTCSDFDECKRVQDHGCHAYADCNNLVGSHNCTCREGYKGNGTYCEDVNECNSKHGGCHSNATCKNTVGSYTCACKGGFNGNGTHCTDINECDKGTHGCHADANCKNIAGSSTCKCKDGFSGNGTHCIDINECDTNDGGCHADATCTNIAGSSTCKCKDGYVGSGTRCNATCAVIKCGSDSDVGQPVCVARTTNVAAHCRCEVNGYVFLTGICVTANMVEVKGLQLDMTYDARYANTSSPEFKLFAYQVEKAVRQLLENQGVKGIIGVQVVRATSGSTVVDFIVVYNATEAPTTKQFLDSSLPTLVSQNLDGFTVIPVVPKTVRASACSLGTLCNGPYEECVAFTGMTYQCQCLPNYVRKEGTCESDALKDWIIAVIVIAVFVFLLIVFVTVAICRLRRRRRGKAQVNGKDNMNYQS